MEIACDYYSFIEIFIFIVCIGADLLEIRTVFFCNACVRYLPIKGDTEEAKERHCMTLTHVKSVEDFRQREKKIAERQRIRMEREEKEKQRKLKQKEEEEKKQKEQSEAEALKKEKEAAEGSTANPDGVQVKEEGKENHTGENDAVCSSFA